MTERTFLVERYCVGNWSRVRGEIPFLATGPNFFKWAFGGSVAKFGEHRFVGSFRADFEEAFGDLASVAARHAASWALLETGIVQALWPDHSRVPIDRRWEASVDALAAEIPHGGTLGEDLIEYLSGLSGPSHFRSYVLEDRIELVPLDPPIEP